MNVLLTGSHGYVGRHLQARFPENWNVVCLDSALSAPSRPYTRDRIRHTRMDLGNLDFGELIKMNEGQKFDVVINLAGLCSVPAGEKSPRLYYAVNVKGVMELVYGLEQHQGSFGLVQMGSCTQLHKKSVYGRTKAMASDFLHETQRNLVELIPHNIVGGTISVGKDSRILNQLMLAHLEKRPALLFHQPNKLYRDYVNVDDVCDVILKAVEFMECNEGKHSFQIGTGIATPIGGLLEKIEEELGEKVLYELEVSSPYGRMDVDATSVPLHEMERTERDLGWKPGTSLTYSIRETFEFYKKSR